MRLLFRTASLLLCLLLLSVSALPAFPTSAEPDFVLRGDANGDGELDALDYILIKKNVLNGTPLSVRGFLAADVNDDGEIDATDYFRVRKVIMGTASFSQARKPIPEEHYKTAVSAGKRYTVSVQPAENYPDEGNIQLTDTLRTSRSSRSYTDERMVGYPVSSRELTVTLDLENSVPDIFEMEISYLAVREAGIGPIGNAFAERSSDGVHWEEAGRFGIPAFADHMQTAVLTTDSPFSARYIRFRIAGTAYWLFLDEITVYADVPRTEDDNRFAERLDRLYRSDGTSVSAAGTAPDRTLPRVNLALGLPYTCSSAPDALYPDPDGVKLTDPDYGNRYGGDTWVGFSGLTDFSVTVDLGAVRSGLAAFEVLSCANRPLGNFFPLRVRFSVSEDGRTWTEAGRCYAPVTDTPVFRFTLESPRTWTGRYVRMSADSAGSGRHLIDNFFVYAYTDESEISAADPYGRFSLPAVTEELVWPVTEDNLRETDLLSGLPVQICIPGGRTCSAPADNTPTGSFALTDGKTASNYNIHTDPYVQCIGDAYRLFYFDLGKTGSVRGAELSFAYYPQWAIHLPETVSLYLSRDGKNWYRAGIAFPEPCETGFHVRTSVTPDKPVAARFLCFRMDIPGWVALDEIRAFGTRALTDETVSPEAEYILDDPNGNADGPGWASPSPDLLGGAGDIFLAYHSSQTVRTEEDLIYQVGYFDRDGQLADTMFDGVLFLMAGGFPSGLGGGTGGVLHYNRSDLDWLTDTLFADGQNVSALDSAVGRLKEQLKLPSDYRVTYYLSLYRPSCDDFGDLNGDGVGEDLTTTEGQLLVLQTAVRMAEERMAQKNYGNISFGGYYWYDESMASDQSDIPLLNAVADCVHAYGRQLFWIPYYSAYGWSSWKRYGLDSACLQPNYAFNLTVPDSRLEAAAVNASRYGMSVEIEMDSRCLTDDRFVDRYFAYLEHGARLGFMNSCIHIYYMSGGSLSRFADSEAPLQRLLYDNTYHFIKKDLQTSPDALPPLSFRTYAGTPVSGRAGECGDVARFRLFESPKHGTVSLSEDGQFTYYPDNGYTGSDSFKVTVSNHMAESAPTAVTVRIQ